MFHSPILDGIIGFKNRVLNILFHQQCFHVFLITQHAESNISSIAKKALYIHRHNFNMVIHCVILYTDKSTD